MKVEGYFGKQSKKVKVVKQEEARYETEDRGEDKGNGEGN